MGEAERLSANDGLPNDCRNKEFGSHPCSRVGPLTVHIKHRVAMVAVHSVGVFSSAEVQIILHLEVLKQFRRYERLQESFVGRMVGQPEVGARSLDKFRVIARHPGIIPTGAVNRLCVRICWQGCLDTLRAKLSVERTARSPR